MLKRMTEVRAEGAVGGRMAAVPRCFFAQYTGVVRDGRGWAKGGDTLRRGDMARVGRERAPDWFAKLRLAASGLAWTRQPSGCACDSTGAANTSSPHCCRVITATLYVDYHYHHHPTHAYCC